MAEIMAYDQDGTIVDPTHPLPTVNWPGHYDYSAVTSVNGAGDPLVIVYKVGGAGGTTVGTLTMTYDGSGNVATITRS